MNKNIIFLIFLIILIAGCTSSSSSNTVTGTYESAQDVTNLTLMVSDNLEIKRTTLFSDEMTRLVLRLFNNAEVYFNNVKVKLINADDLNPSTEQDSVEFIQPNTSNVFQWDLTAPTLSSGEVLILNDISVRTYYDTYSTALKSIILKEPGDRNYMSTYEESSKSPIKLYFDTSYESVTTLADDEVKDFTVNLIYYNEFNGIVDYYDNSEISDNYIKSLVLILPKELIFYNYLEDNSPWIKIDNTLSVEEISQFNATHEINIDNLDSYDYYIVDYKNIDYYGDSYGFSSLCDLMQQSQQENSDINNLKEEITKQKRILWMTKGYTKINVLKLGAKTVNSDTELNIRARIDYSFSQDFGGNNFGVAIYGTG